MNQVIVVTIEVESAPMQRSLRRRRGGAKTLVEFGRSGRIKGMLWRPNDKDLQCGATLCDGSSEVDAVAVVRLWVTTGDHGRDRSQEEVPMV
jgi:hypothetical protein